MMSAYSIVIGEFKQSAYMGIGSFTSANDQILIIGGDVQLIMSSINGGNIT